MHMYSSVPLQRVYSYRELIRPQLSPPKLMLTDGNRARNSSCQDEESGVSLWLAPPSSSPRPSWTLDCPLEERGRLPPVPRPSVSRRSARPRLDSCQGSKPAEEHSVSNTILDDSAQWSTCMYMYKIIPQSTTIIRDLAFCR